MQLVIDLLEKEIEDIEYLDYKPLLKEFNAEYIKQLKKAIEILKNESII